MTITYIIAFLVTFALTLLFAPIVFNLIKKMRAKQTILHYVKEHKNKQGTPTMGGIMFILPAIVIPLIFYKTDFMYGIITLGVFFVYGLFGFLDDFIKVHYKQNLGLRAYQKIIGQLAIALIVALFVYKQVGTTMYVPFTNQLINVGILIIPIVVVIYIATVNSVNLIDGMDGLCSGVSINFLSFFSFILIIFSSSKTGVELLEMQNLIITTMCLLGALFGFLCFNSYPAKIFMGDTGSLAIGGFIATICVFTRLELLLPILGMLYVVTAISDIVQVLYYKKTKKRVFKMAPLHHHFQMSGVHESKIVFIYFTISLVINLITLAIYL